MKPDLSARPGPTSRRAVISGFIIGVVVAAGILLVVSEGDVDRMVRSDGLVYRYVAAHLNQDPEDVVQPVVDRGTSLRYGRIGFPVVLWVFSAGRLDAMRYAQPIVIVLTAGFAAAACIRLFRQRRSLAAAIPFFAPGFVISIIGGYADLLGAAFALWFLVFARDERWTWALALLAAAVITKETYVIVLAGCALWMILSHRISQVPLLGLALVPALIWYAYVASRYGHIPPFDPYLRTTTETLGTPFLGLWGALTSAPARSALLAGIHAVVAVFSLSQWRRGLIGAIAAVAGLGIFVSGKFAWTYTAEAGRVFLLLQLFAILAGIELAVRRTVTSPSRDF